MTAPDLIEEIGEIFEEFCPADGSSASDAVQDVS